MRCLLCRRCLLAVCDDLLDSVPPGDLAVDRVLQGRENSLQVYKNYINKL